jgi:hypothetical protein
VDARQCDVDHGGAFAGSCRGVAEEIKTFSIEAMDTVLGTGDTRSTQAGGYCCRMFRWRELAKMIAAQPCRLLAASASNAISLAAPEVLDRLAADPGVWPQFLDWEEELAQEPGMLDGGTHILFAIEHLSGGDPAHQKSNVGPHFSVFPTGAESWRVDTGSMLGETDRAAAPKAALTRCPRAGQSGSQEDGCADTGLRA